MTPAVRAGLEKTGLSYARWHLFLCPGPDCSPRDEGLATWGYIKRRLKETGAPAMRTKADCLRVCVGGPWLVVYPDGVWYGGVTPERFERILREHILGGSPVREWIAAEGRLEGRGRIHGD